MLNFRCLIAVQVLLALILGFPLHGWLDFSSQPLRPKYPQVRPEEAQAMARFMAGSYGSLALAALGFLLPGPWPYRRKSALGFCLANLVAAALMARSRHAFSNDWFSYGLLFAHFLLAVGFFLNTLDPDTGDAEPPGARWFSFPNVLTASVTGMALTSLAAALLGVGSFTRHPGQIDIVLGLLFLPLLAVLLALALSTYLTRSFFQGEDKIRARLLKQLGETAAQEERNRLARDLHDSIKQQLFTIHLGVAAARERWERDPPGARARLDDIARSAKEALAEMRALLQQLAPHAVASAGLIEALREQCEALGYRTGAKVDFEIGEPLPEDRLPAQAQESLFRIAQEALSNVARHARAEHVRVALGRQGDTVALEIEDDGRGFEPGQEARGLGLRNMEERTAELGGNCRLRSQPDAGTALTVTIPLLANAPARADHQVLKGVRISHDLATWSFGLLLGVAAADPAAWIGLPPKAIPVAFLALLALTLALASRASRRGRRQLVLPEAGEPVLTALDHRTRAWFALAALVQCLWIAGPPASWTTPGRALWGISAVLLIPWAGWELFRLHRSTTFRGGRALQWTWGILGIGAAALAAFLLLRQAPDRGSASFAFMVLAGFLFVHTQLRRIPTPPS